ncbi:Protein MSP1 [Fusarium oxysporum f. sp. albedinis]|nr:Protein MSP1 [Fusarium oxysporum f. sp. albedinis]
MRFSSGLNRGLDESRLVGWFAMNVCCLTSRGCPHSTSQLKDLLRQCCCRKKIVILKYLVTEAYAPETRFFTRYIPTPSHKISRLGGTRNATCSDGKETPKFVGCTVDGRRIYRLYVGTVPSCTSTRETRNEAAVPEGGHDALLGYVCRSWKKQRSSTPSLTLNGRVSRIETTRVSLLQVYPVR